ncbi:MAG TPA: PAS domain-containing protein, partial [Candidatus Nitrosotenuis sp.]|nr:PAS domain-containing protein [Candidatus Nitrosotenuis sp.]
MTLENTIAISRGLILLFRPFVEVVIHDLASETIAFIEGGLSDRQKGDPSQLEPDISSWIGD